ncbi:MAG: hypothetical protein A2057_09560 [Ignavibacteria bacterium GWA2_35_9]|nr:MAG: hypothetical protein A2057_09560 [Ignavibacteria bacterium GWA2_35_9]OGU43953.1 MAG: hypothetical protein A2000_00985 [Ignavibacteria bacterium GWB2_36_8]OGU53763.1 MAG: hypothetical protein A2080_06065 [Ignavibacteria bacterium GWC2_36_12]
MSMLLIAIFSLNRAILLEALLNSVTKNLLSDDGLVSIKVLYGSTDEKFEEGYHILKVKIKDNRIEFIRKELGKYQTDLSLLLRPRNFWYYLKYPFFRVTAKIYNFKELLEKMLKESNSSCVSFFTDDSLILEKIKITPEILSLVNADPEQNSFSLRHGLNIRNNPSSIKSYKGFYSWKFDELYNDSHWSYRFSIDGHIYNTKFILSFIKRILYVNPNSFEGVVCQYAKIKNKLSQGYCLSNSVLAGFEVNRVQTAFANNNLDIDNAMLNDFFLKGFQLNYIFDKENVKDFRPKLINIQLSSPSETINLL